MKQCKPESSSYIESLSQHALAAASSNSAGFFLGQFSICKMKCSVCLQHTQGIPLHTEFNSSYMNTNLPLGRKFLIFRTLNSRFFKRSSGQSRHMFSIECVRSPENNEIDSLLFVHMCQCYFSYVSVSQGGISACRLMQYVHKALHKNIYHR